MPKTLPNDKNPIESVLVLEHIVCDKLSFNRLGFKSDDSSVETNIAHQVNKHDDNVYRVQLSLSSTKKDEYEAAVHISGFFSISEDEPHKDILLNQNSLTILLPYARAQMTLLTAQPETTPLVLPVINVSELVKHSNKSNSGNM